MRMNVHALYCCLTFRFVISVWVYRWGSVLKTIWNARVEREHESERDARACENKAREEETERDREQKKEQEAERGRMLTARRIARDLQVCTCVYACMYACLHVCMPPAPMNRVKYLRAGPAEMPFQNWYTANTNHFHLTDSVSWKSKTQLG